MIAARRGARAAALCPNPQQQYVELRRMPRQRPLSSPRTAVSIALKEDNLPIHLEAGALAQDPRDAGALYAVYSLTPYSEVWRTAIEARNLMRRPDPMSLAGRIGLSLLAIVAGALLARFLVRARLAEPRGS